MDEVNLSKLGWKAFQDLCIAITEERLQRPVQTFLPSNDAGRDGAFLGTWDAVDDVESTVQCKFTSKNSNLTLSMLADEIPKAQRLAAKGLAHDYIILTNHSITGSSELIIKEAFQSVGVKRCRVFHKDWIIQRVNESPALRMMVPRLYGLMDLTSILDTRAYKQAQLILSEMGDNLQKLVVTDPHRKSVRAISEHNLVLLLGSPATGKSTIGASLALGASDIWGSFTIKSTSPAHLEKHIDPDGGQFFWIDDAWGSTQFQRERTEAWNQVFPLMQGAMKKGTRFLITSRDYIWQQARKELKLQALPVLAKSQVVINVQELTIEEKARILYNHLKLGDQTKEFRLIVKRFLPSLAARADFLPESARRLGTKIFTEELVLTESLLVDFFARPKVFLQQTILNLAPECKAAIALIFLNGGLVRSPVSSEALEKPSEAFGVEPANVRNQLQILDGSLLNLIEDEEGPYWMYRHPTISDAFASYVAESTELVEIYLRGAKPETIVREVVCSNVNLSGAAVVIANKLHPLLLDRIGNLPSHTLGSFLSYRSNTVFTESLLALRPDIWKRLDYFRRPLKDDSDVDLLTKLHRQNLLSETKRLEFVAEVRAATCLEADDSILLSEEIAAVLTESEREIIINEAKKEVLEQPQRHIDRLRENWDGSYDPNDYFDELKSSFRSFAKILSTHSDVDALLKTAEKQISYTITDMEDTYDPPGTVDTPIQQSEAHSDSLEELFRDIDD